MPRSDTWAAQPLPKGAVVIKPSVLKRMVPMKHAVYHNAPGLKLSATVSAPAARPVVRAQKTSAGLKVAKAFPLHSNLENHGKYGHEAEEILTTHSGAVRVAQGSFKSHLRGAAPAVSVQAAPKLRSKRDMSMHQQARELAEALDDCRDDPSDDCQTELHLGSNDKQVKAFEEDQDAADKGLFRIFESAQRIRDANGIRIAPGGMLAQMPPPVAAIPGQSSSGRVDGFGIPDGGSLPGDNV